MIAKMLLERFVVGVALGIGMGVVAPQLFMSKESVGKRGRWNGASRIIHSISTLGVPIGSARSVAMLAIHAHQGQACVHWRRLLCHLPWQALPWSMTRARFTRAEHRVATCALTNHVRFARNFYYAWEANCPDAFHKCFETNLLRILSWPLIHQVHITPISRSFAMLGAIYVCLLIFTDRSKGLGYCHKGQHLVTWWILFHRC